MVNTGIISKTLEDMAKANQLRDEYWNIVTCTEPADYETAKKNIFQLYNLIGRTPPENVVYGTPLKCIRKILKTDSLTGKYLAELFNEQYQSMFDSVKNTIMEYVRDNRIDYYDLEGVALSVVKYDSIDISMQQDVWDVYRERSSYRKFTQIPEPLKGAGQASNIGFLNILGLATGLEYKANDSRILEICENIARSCGWWWPFENYLFIADRPASISYDRRNGRHIASGPYMAFRDGLVCWHLNGVRVPQWLGETPAKDIKCERILKIRNAEVRREFVRKVGIERICSELGKEVLDFQPGNDLYQLIILDLPGHGRSKFLKMRNPSLGIYHIEGVPNSVRNIREALHSRKPFALRQIPVSKDGDDWYQQGDVCIWNPKSKSIKPMPKQLT